MNKSTSNPSKIEPKDKYSLYTFNLTDNNISEFEITIIQPIRHPDKGINLYFYPKNYVKEVKTISIEIPKNKYKLSELENRTYKIPEDIQCDERRHVVDLHNKSEIYNIYIFENYTE